MPGEEAVDVSSPYGAAGWNLERQAAAEDDDLATLPESELATIRHGLHKTLGHTETNRLSQNMSGVEQDQKKEKVKIISKKRNLEGSPNSGSEMLKNAPSGLQRGLKPGGNTSKGSSGVSSSSAPPATVVVMRTSNAGPGSRSKYIE